MKLQRILVTGGAGFIGSHTVDLLLHQGKEVTVLDNLFSGKLENLDLTHPNLEFVEGDILEFPLVESLIEKSDAVLHLAAIASVPLSIEEPIYSFQVNTQGFLHVLIAVKQSSRPVRLVYASSAAVYGDAGKQLPCREDQTRESLLSPYALQKAHCEDYAKLYTQLYQIESLGLRYFNVYGLRQDPHSPYSGVISRFLERYKKEAPLTIFGDGQQSRDFIYVTEVAKANALALEADYTGILNIATGEAKTLLDLIQDIEAAGQHPIKYQFEPERAGDIKSSYAAIKMAEQHLGFRSTTSLKEGMKMLLAIP